MNFIGKIFNIKTEKLSNRIYYLDFVRGILILLVLYHHSMAPFNAYVLQFHMPALFVLSGYTEFLLNQNKPFGLYVKSKFFRLIVPYICFEVINLIIYTFMALLSGEIDFSFWDAGISIVTCINNSYIGLYGRLWFLPAIFVVSILSYVVKHITKNNTYVVSLFCIVMFTMSYVSSAIIPYRLPFTIDIAFLGTAFFLLGHICGGAIKYIFECKKHWLVLLSLFVFGAVFVLCNKIASPTCYMFINQYTDFAFMVGSAISGTAITFIVAKYLFYIFSKISILKNIIFWYSVNSLAVFPTHLTIKVLSIPLLALLGCNNWFFLFVIMFVLTIPIVNIINDYFPFMLGSFKHKKASP